MVDQQTTRGLDQGATAPDTIAAIATPPGKGGVGVIRISGALAADIGQQVCGRPIAPRKIINTNFTDANGVVIDSGLCLRFVAPASFTGEDVVELQGHGGPVIQDLLMQRVLELGARQARAGEFSERAFINDKIDLAQAEAIADLIDSSTAQAARGAMRSLQGEFSAHVRALLKELIALRMYVEAAIDFPEEEIDFLAEQKVQDQVQRLTTKLSDTIAQAGQGAILRNGFNLVLAGKPNAGKSSLLNALAGEDAAIVTDIPGTTRDTVRVTIELDGLPVHIVDTAGLRDSDDTVEKIGVERARSAIAAADHVLELVDLSDPDQSALPEFDVPTTRVYNKLDLAAERVPEGVIAISATRGDGMQELTAMIKAWAGFEGNSESLFTARRRHLSALDAAQAAVERGLQQLQTQRAGELLADELLQAQNALNQITGEFNADDLLGEIFAGFCIGK
ncbi:MAG: tRNA uridine-5-carboxymethylaminomethyl(34) synthesis GTPase MnmE [Gammaproteobacteria bacterium]|nr:tRNA uridine-5-carboxymethylaminomethyl(34) synthesis GTPase MnmE [Gammaproteobacteria bacterium]